MPELTTVNAVAIKAGKMTSAAPNAELVEGETRLSAKDWDAVAAICKGEAELLKKLGVTDQRQKTK